MWHLCFHSQLHSTCTRQTAHTLGNGLLAVTTANTDTIDDIALLGFVSETPGLVRSRWAGSTVDDVQLAIFPASIGGHEDLGSISR
jgi:hypothetical protein